MIRTKCRFAPALAMFLACAIMCRAQSAEYTQLKPETIEGRLLQYEGEDAQRGITLMRLFEEAGCNGDRLRLQPVKDADAPNVICTLAGDSGKLIIVGAHFDRVDKGNGVADNWSGASLLPSLYQSLSPKKRKHTFIFVGFSDEEEGFIGSRFYADQLTGKELSSIQAMINLDTLGLDSTRVWTSNSNPGLAELLSKVAARLQLPLNTMNVDEMGNSDGSSFRERGIPTLTLHSVTWTNLYILHSEKDQFKAIDMDEYYDSYKLIAAYLAILDRRELPLTAPEHDGKKGK